jgi:hypothetical protein
MRPSLLVGALSHPLAPYAFALYAAALSFGGCGGKAVIDPPSDDAGSSSSSSGSSTVSTSVSSSSSGGACISCSEALEGDTIDFANLCPASLLLLNDLRECACVDRCLIECDDNACGGGPGDDACNDCVDAFCGPEFDACLAD